MTPESFIARWQKSEAAERANYALFLTELCTLLDVPHPDPTQADDAANAYVFERAVKFAETDGTTSDGRIDLYRRGSFVLEAKQGSDAETAEEAEAEALQAAAAKKPKKRGTAVRGTKGWDDAMLRARGQADRYARALPVSEGWPPFLIVVDVGHSIELYSDFSRSGKTYVQFPDPQSFRILLDDLKRDDVRARLRQVWLDPLALDPSRRAAKVTRELAERLAELAKLLEKAKHDPEDVAKFLMRSLFTMFAEDVELIPRGSFKSLLYDLRDNPEDFKPAAEDLWRTMNTGGFSPILKKRLLRFNGGLFAESEALPLTKPMLELLHEAAGADWTDVEPAIFGTLLERALDPIERHKLGAHYTPRAYVERLVLPTVIEPLREDWQAAFAVAVSSAKAGDLAAAQKTVHTFHEQLCKTRVLDPACGSGNFLYVTLEQMKRLEGEVLNALREFGDKQATLFEVDPHQFLGIEVNPRAAAIADLVLWIGYLQWHFRTRGHAAPAEPIIKNYKNIECRDAVLAWDRKEAVLDDKLQPVTRWNGRTMKIHPVTGEEVPDETKRVLVERYINPRKAEWPKAEFVVGNPPFIGSKRMRDALGDDYVDALQTAWSEVPQATDFVLRWWHSAALLLRQSAIRRFGFIATNSIWQAFNRRAIEPHLRVENGVSLAMVVPDHPWVDSADGASVRISMTVVRRGLRPGLLRRVVAERDDGGQTDDLVVAFEESIGSISADFKVGTDTTSVAELQSNFGLCAVGMKTIGSSFVVTRDEINALNLKSDTGVSEHIRPYLNGRDLAGTTRDVFVIDTFGMTEESLQAKFPTLFQYLLTNVKPERLSNRNKLFRETWWVIGHPRPVFREFSKSLKRYIATIETSKHRFFVFLDKEIVPDSTLVTFGFSDALMFGVLSSSIHVQWAKTTGGRLGVGNDLRYNKTKSLSENPCGS